jgi:hypothetical protein
MEDDVAILDEIRYQKWISDIAEPHFQARTQILWYML